MRSVSLWLNLSISNHSAAAFFALSARASLAALYPTSLRLPSSHNRKVSDFKLLRNVNGCTLWKSGSDL